MAEEEEIKKTTKKAARKRVVKVTEGKIPRKKALAQRSTPREKEPSAPVPEFSQIKVIEDVIPEPSAKNEAPQEEEKKEGNRRGRGRRGPSRENETRAPQQARAIDMNEAAVKAWEIYQAELEEEGVSLVDSRRGREVAQRCLELARVFCEERDKFLERQ